MGDGDQTEEEIRFSAVLSSIAERHGLASPTTIALAYVLDKAPYVFPIVGGRKVEVSTIVQTLCTAANDI
jgi:aryl-alcohol dehydrogenase-like predicted oxidoreductase